MADQILLAVFKFPNAVHCCYVALRRLTLPTEYTFSADLAMQKRKLCLECVRLTADSIITPFSVAKDCLQFVAFVAIRSRCGYMLSEHMYFGCLLLTGALRWCFLTIMVAFDRE